MQADVSWEGYGYIQEVQVPTRWIPGGRYLLLTNGEHKFEDMRIRVLEWESDAG